MVTYLALFRGINVGGRNKLPMQGLRELLEDLGAQNPRTVLQSGNAAFELAASKSKAFRAALSSGIEERFGFEPHVMLLGEKDLADALKGNPFPKAVAEPKTLHVFFLDSLPKAPDSVGLDGLAIASESWRLRKRVFYMHAPDGFGRSKLAAGAERRLGVPTTARNWATMQRLVDLVAERPG